MTSGLPHGYSTRGGRYPDDVDDVASLYAASDLVDVGFEDVSRPMIDDHWRSERFAPAGDAMLVVAPDGSLAASGECGWSPGVPVDTFIRVHPVHRARGLGAWLIAWAEARAAVHVDAGAGPAVWNSVAATDASAIELLVSRGYRPVRTFWHMERSLDDVDPDPPVPRGIAIRRVEVPGELPALHACMIEAFAEHFGAAETPFEEWRARWMDLPGVDPGLFLLAWSDRELTGAAMSTPAYQVGWIADVGVRAPWRGRGIGEALLRSTFAALAARGFTQARLNVDAGNETGATRLYERSGMHVRREWLVHEKALGAG